MKKLLSILVISLITFSVNAQEKIQMSHTKDGLHTNRHQHREHRHHHKGVMKSVNLSDVQKAQMKTAREDLGSKMNELRKEDNITVAEMRTKRTALHKEQKEKINNIFTADQKKQIAQNMADIKTHRKEIHEKRVKEMQAKLGLSSDQVASLKAQHEATHAQVKAIRENNSLSREDKIQQVKAIRNTSKEQLKNLLTADQLKKLEEIKKDRRNIGSQQSKK